MKKNIVVIGCGYWGKNIVRNFYDVGSLYGVADVKSEVSKKFSDKYDVKNFSIDEALNHNSVDAIAICTPAETHAEIAIKAMQSGKDVFVEKPLALNEIDAFKIKDVVDKTGKKLMVGHLLQYHPAFEKVLQIIDSDLLGRIKKVFSERMSFGKIRKEEDVIWSFAPHDISMILRIIKSFPTKVICNGTNIISENLYDEANINLIFEDKNINAQINVSWLHPIKRHIFTVIGTKGMIIFDDTKDWDEKVFYQEFKLDAKTGLTRTESKFLKIDTEEPLKRECSYFIDYINDIKDSRTGVEEGIEIVSILRKISSQ